MCRRSYRGLHRYTRKQFQIDRLSHELKTVKSGSLEEKITAEFDARIEELRGEVKRKETEMHKLRSCFSLRKRSSQCARKPKY